jgi:predicted Rossmann-fold nucleotide-binding protein
VLEVITLRQLGYHDKPVVLLNAGGFFDPLLEQFERLYAEAFRTRRSARFTR